MEETQQVAPVIAPDVPAFGPKRWRGWPIFGITVFGVAVLYLAQIIVSAILFIFTYFPYARAHPGTPTDVNTISKLVFTAPALFATVVPGEALMAFLAIVLVAGAVGATRANLGFARPPKAVDLLIGILAGLALVLVSFIVGELQEKVFGPHPQASVEIIKSHHGLASFAFDFVGVALAAGVCEEIMFRGVVFAALVQRMPLWWAAALSGLIFAAAHADYWSIAALWAVGMGLCFLYYRSRTLWANMIAHTTFNAVTLVFVYFLPQLAK
ncbi:MAG TPA: type II CAAX endopeptidase family protein [Candidatus Eremiobacteraceae bacterium]